MAGGRGPSTGAQLSDDAAVKCTRRLQNCPEMRYRFVEIPCFDRTPLRSFSRASQDEPSLERIWGAKAGETMRHGLLARAAGAAPRLEDSEQPT
jgi:hypothetical protein